MKKFIRKFLYPVFDIVISLLLYWLAFCFILFVVEALEIFQLPRKYFFVWGFSLLMTIITNHSFIKSICGILLTTTEFFQGIDWNTDEQLNLLKCFAYNNELTQFPENQESPLSFYYYRNPSYGTGDSEFLYNIIRYC